MQVRFRKFEPSSISKYPLILYIGKSSPNLKEDLIGVCSSRCLIIDFEKFKDEEDPGKVAEDLLKSFLEEKTKDEKDRVHVKFPFSFYDRDEEDFEKYIKNELRREKFRRSILKFYESFPFEELIMYGRHLRVSTFIECHPSVRLNAVVYKANYVFLEHTDRISRNYLDYDDVRRDLTKMDLYRKYFSVFHTFSDFCKVMDGFGKNTLMVRDFTTKSLNIEDLVFFYKVS